MVEKGREAWKRRGKSARKLERHFKGVANHWRIEILLLVAEEPGLSLVQITERVDGNMKTIAEHVRRLSLAGLVEKKYQGHEMQHSLTPYGREFTDFIIEFSRHGSS